MDYAISVAQIVVSVILIILVFASGAVLGAFRSFRRRRRRILSDPPRLGAPRFRRDYRFCNFFVGLSILNLVV